MMARSLEAVHTLTTLTNDVVVFDALNIKENKQSKLKLCIALLFLHAKERGKNMQKKNGISLIVLVITIIVMIILAGAIILSLNNAGIIGKANEAVEKTNIAQVNTLAQLKWSEVYLDENVEKTDESMKEAVISKLEAEGVDTSEYVIVVTTNGAEVVDGWIQDGLTVKKGDTVLTVGDDIAYDETAEGAVEVLKDVAWKVLGANDKGELLIMSTTDVADLVLGDPEKKDLVECQNDWLTAEKQLDELCDSYKYGKSATGSRSIKIEDIDKITGYDKTIFSEGTISEYGAKGTITYNETNKPAYTVSTASKDFSGTFEYKHNTFYYYDGTKFVSVNPTEGTKNDVITTFENNHYSYVVDMDKTSKAYTMLFKDTLYWLASVSSSIISQSFAYCIVTVSYEQVAAGALCYSFETCPSWNDHSRGVRAVVSLQPDIIITGSSTSGWSY